MDSFTEFALKLINHEASGTLFPPLMTQRIEQRYLNSTSLFSAYKSSNLEITTRTTTQFDVSDYGFLLPAGTREPAPVSGFSYIDDEMSELQKLLLLQNSEKLLGLEHISSHRKGKQPINITDENLGSVKRLRSSASSADSYILDTILKNHFLPNPNSSPPPISLKSPPAPKLRSPPTPKLRSPSLNVLARERRKLIGDRTKLLQKLMPWDKKMDIATMLEEAYKYIKFLQAQVSVLQSMPSQSSFITPLQMMTVGGGSCSGNSGGAANGFGGLEKLTRQQLLQVLVNSPVVQTALYSRECYIYSTEQLMLLNNKFVLQEMMSFSSSNRS